uniref:Uncharacterized protein n=1 Tax=Giardia muris TaxID=5742 RepID=Q24999_GIAMU|nr:unknown [Giardia muris]
MPWPGSPHGSSRGPSLQGSFEVSPGVPWVHGALEVLQDERGRGPGPHGVGPSHGGAHGSIGGRGLGSTPRPPSRDPGHRTMWSYGWAFGGPRSLGGGSSNGMGDHLPHWGPGSPSTLTGPPRVLHERDGGPRGPGDPRGVPLNLWGLGPDPHGIIMGGPSPHGIIVRVRGVMAPSYEGRGLPGPSRGPSRRTGPPPIGPWTFMGGGVVHHTDGGSFGRGSVRSSRDRIQGAFTSPHTGHMDRVIRGIRVIIWGPGLISMDGDSPTGRAPFIDRVPHGSFRG